ncbi:hypothetical protein BC629DRAFT_1438648 [Irpex lacteus]|nr:hypothetical protein BC629DRAFT_1438648 [Irpex lacteus]
MRDPSTDRLWLVNIDILGLALATNLRRPTWCAPNHTPRSVQTCTALQTCPRLCDEIKHARGPDTERLNYLCKAQSSPHRESLRGSHAEHAQSSSDLIFTINSDQDYPRLVPLSLYCPYGYQNGSEVRVPGDNHVRWDLMPKQKHKRGAYDTYGGRMLLFMRSVTEARVTPTIRKVATPHWPVTPIITKNQRLADTHQDRRVEAPTLMQQFQIASSSAKRVGRTFLASAAAKGDSIRIASTGTSRRRIRSYFASQAPQLWAMADSPKAEVGPIARVDQNDPVFIKEWTGILLALRMTIVE